MLNARNAFAPIKGDERNERVGLSVTGPLWKRHTSVSLSADATDAFDTKTIVAALPSGTIADSVRKPNDLLNFSGRVEHALSTTQMLRVEAQRNHADSNNLGVGDFDLRPRAYRQTRHDNVLRGSIAGSIRKALFNELRLEWRQEDIATASATDSPAVLVLDAFNSGGAQIDGAQRAREIEFANDLDIASGKHAIRTGVLVDSRRSARTSVATPAARSPLPT